MAGIRRATKKLLRNISGAPEIVVTGNPVQARIKKPEIAFLDPPGVGCALYASAFEEIASLYLGRKANVAHARCATNDGGYCEWQLEG
jgi:hypothetical protein